MAEIRLSKLTKEFNIGLQTLVDFLNGQGAGVEMNPNAKISDSYLPAIESKFGDEQKLKQDSEKVAIKLKEIIEQEGVDGFIEIENQVNASIEADRTVVATGGSVVYGEEAMAHLKKIATVIYLRLSYEELDKRLGNLKNRGVVLREGQTLKDLYEERIKLYEKYADLIVDEENKGIEETLQAIVKVL